MKKDTFDILVEIQKIEGTNSDSARGSVPVGRMFRGFLEKDCIDSDGNPKIGERVDVTGKLSTSELQSIEKTEDPSILVLNTKTGKYRMKVVRKTKLRHSI
jgi:hypothetical protein